MGGGGFGGHADPEIRAGRGGGRSYKKKISALRASVWSKNKGVGERAPPPGSVTAFSRGNIKN